MTPTPADVRVQLERTQKAVARLLEAKDNALEQLRELSDTLAEAEDLRLGVRLAASQEAKRFATYLDGTSGSSFEFGLLLGDMADLTILAQTALEHPETTEVA